MSGIFLHIERLFAGYALTKDGHIQVVTKVHRTIQPTDFAPPGVIVLPVSDPSHYREGYSKEFSDPVEPVFRIAKRTLLKAKPIGTSDLWRRTEHVRQRLSASAIREPGETASLAKDPVVSVNETKILLPKRKGINPKEWLVLKIKR